MFGFKAYFYDLKGKRTFNLLCRYFWPLIALKCRMVLQCGFGSTSCDS